MRVPCIFEYFSKPNSLKEFTNILFQFIDYCKSENPTHKELRRNLIEIKVNYIKFIFYKKNLFVFKKFVCSKTDQFDGYEQQDSNEFLTYLLSIMHTEMMTRDSEYKPYLNAIYGTLEQIESKYRVNKTNILH
jgi:uncharacterized UBP type Zn finger protein